MKIHNPIRFARRQPVVFGLGAISLIVIATGVFLKQIHTHQHQAEIALRGSQVMPFNLDATTHIFQPLADGGLQTVVADNLTDATQIKLIQEHLKEESQKFGIGDFSDPSAIHGNKMPGLRELKDGYQEIDVEYAAISNGATLRYTTQRADLVSAIHTWFEAQRSDHAHHAE